MLSLNDNLVDGFKKIVNGFVSLIQLKKYRRSLFTPTFITKLSFKSKSYYFIVDCWHHRVIFSQDLNCPIKRWKTLTDNISGPHSIVSDGELLLVEDTGRNGIMIFKYMDNGKFNFHQYISDIGARPHRIIYDEGTSLFYCICPFSENVVIIENKWGVAFVRDNIKLPFLKDSYVRSIKIIDDKMYFIAVKDKIYSCNYTDNSFEIIDEINIDIEFRNMNDMFKYEDYYYITAGPKKFIRVKDLHDIKNGNYENLYEDIGFKGTPYYINVIDGDIFVPEISEYSSIISLKIKVNQISNVKRIFDCKVPSKSSLLRYYSFPK